MASNRRVSIEDADAVYRRLEKIRDLLKRLPPMAEMLAITGPMDTSIGAIKYYAEQLEDRKSELFGSMQMLENNTNQAILDVRSTLEGLFETDAEAKDEVTKLTVSTERFGSRPRMPRGR